MNNRLKQIRNIIYALKREYGESLVLREQNAVSSDYTAGTQIVNTLDHMIRRAVVLPTREVRSFSYDLSFIAANKNFTYGGLYDLLNRVVIIDGTDLSDGYVPNLDDQCILDKEVYEIKEVHETRGKYGYILLIRRVTADAS